VSLSSGRSFPCLWYWNHSIKASSCGSNSISLGKSRLHNRRTVFSLWDIQVEFTQDLIWSRCTTILYLCLWLLLPCWLLPPKILFWDASPISPAVSLNRIDSFSNHSTNSMRDLYSVSFSQSARQIKGMISSLISNSRVSGLWAFQLLCPRFEKWVFKRMWRNLRDKCDISNLRIGGVLRGSHRYAVSNRYLIGLGIVCIDSPVGRVSANGLGFIKSSLRL
jgi:hypothetical protein